MTRALCLAAALLGAALLAPTPARAQSASAEDRGAADALYSEASDLMKVGHFAEACPKLETSERLDPGIGSIIRLGFCYENLGRMASAWTAYNEGEARARKANDKRADDAAARAKALEAKLSRLLISPKGPVPGLDVKRDGKSMDPGLWGTAVPVDPGEHTIEANAPGKQPWRTTTRIDAPGVVTVAIPPLAQAPTDATSGAPYWNGQRLAGVVLGGLSLPGIIVGSVFGVQTFNKNSASMPYCPHVPTSCYAQGVGLRNDAYSAAEVSTLAFAAGGVTVAAGLITFFTATRKPTTATPAKTTGGLQGVQIQPIVDSRSGVLLFRGSW